MNIEFPNLFNKTQMRIIHHRANSYFERSEDKKDFIQNVFLLAWENWVEKGKPLFNGKPDIYRVDYLVLSARGLTLKRQVGYTDSRAGEVLIDDDENASPFEIEHVSFGEILDKCVPANPKDKIHSKQFRLITENGIKISLTYDEIQEFTGYERGSVGRMRSLGRELKVFLFDGKIYSSLKRIQDKFNLTEAAARWRAKKISFYWDDNFKANHG
jgi:hypothetical protein